MKNIKTKSKNHTNIILWIAGILLGLSVLTLLAFRLSPWPGALVIRSVFNRGSTQTHQSLAQHATDQPVSVKSNLQYRSDDKDAYLDVYTPQSAIDQNKQLPILIWTHGGAWLSGDKTDAEGYYKILASKNFTVISVNYSLAPGKIYPTAVHQLNDAHSYIVKNSTTWNADVSKIMLAGDSAGSQLSSQLAAIITNPSYAQEVGVKPALTTAQLKGVLLFCGIYKMEGLATPDPTLPKIVGWGDDVSVWAYTGSKNRDDPSIRQMSAYYHATKDYPATFITGGNADPLTDHQSKPFAQKLSQMGVPVTPVFFDADHSPALPHEYQFTLDTDGRNTLDVAVKFMKERTNN